MYSREARCYCVSCSESGWVCVPSKERRAAARWLVAICRMAHLQRETAALSEALIDMNHAPGITFPAVSAAPAVGQRYHHPRPELRLSAERK